MPLNATFWKSCRHSWVLYFLFYAVWANLVFWTAAAKFGLALHGWFCFDYVVVGIISLFLPRLASALLLGLAISLDLLCGVCETFYIAPAQVFTSSEAIREFSLTRDLGLTAIAALVITVVWSSILLKHPSGAGSPRAKAALALGLFALICFTVELIQVGGQAKFLLHSSGGFGSADILNESRFHHMRPARDPARKLLLESIFEYRVEQFAKQHRFQGGASASAAAISLLPMQAWQSGDDHGKPNVVLVILESWGFAVDSTLRASLVSAYSNHDLLNKYRILEGTAPFFGSTVPGEVRELCGNTSGFEILRSSSAALRNCLPDRFASIGYRNIAVHGMDGHLFDRLRWYPNLGFNELLFRDQFEKLGLPICPGAFPGVCDGAIADWIGDQLQDRDPKPKFIYWVTLNSHLPVPDPPVLTNPAPCSISPGLVQGRALCDWYQLVANVHRAVAAVALRPTSRPTVFIVVGDHAPPFSASNLRAQFSQTVVPYILLIPTNIKTGSRVPIHSNAALTLETGKHLGG